MNRFSIGMVCLCAAVAAPSGAQIIDHDDIDGVASLPQSTMDAIGQQRWFFTHASVGGNMINGMDDLHGADPGRYQLQSSSVGYNDPQQRADNPPSPTVLGTVYECDRGNPGWEAKFTIFQNSVNVSGWHDVAVDVVMDKLCFIDQDADANQYVSAMSTLEAAYPTTAFVYTTMPLTTSEDDENVLRNQYNAVVRAYCTANSKLLFDLADMEAHDPSGTLHTFSSGGNTYHKLYSGYSDDGGHLNAAGQQRIALGWYAVAASLVSPETETYYGLSLSAINGGWGSVSVNPEPNMSGVPRRYPPGTPVTLTASANAGRFFDHWEVYDPNYPGDSAHALIVSDNPMTLMMDTNKNVAVVFGCSGGMSCPLMSVLLGTLLVGALLRNRRRG